MTTQTPLRSTREGHQKAQCTEKRPLARWLSFETAARNYKTQKTGGGRGECTAREETAL